jgi:hypothetical protein
VEDETMTDQSKTRKTGKQIENLELNRETVQDLGEAQTEGARGGMLARRPGDTQAPTCKHSCFDSCYATDCCLIVP